MSKENENWKGIEIRIIDHEGNPKERSTKIWARSFEGIDELFLLLIDIANSYCHRVLGETNK